MQSRFLYVVRRDEELVGSYESEDEAKAQGKAAANERAGGDIRIEALAQDTPNGVPLQQWTYHRERDDWSKSIQ